MVNFKKKKKKKKKKRKKLGMGKQPTIDITSPVKSILLIARQGNKESK